jgi:hypothetical protein
VVNAVLRQLNADCWACASAVRPTDCLSRTRSRFTWEFQLSQLSSPLVLVPLVAASLALSVVPVWFAAKVVGAGRTEFSKSAVALALPTFASIGLLFLIGNGSLLVIPLLFWISFKYVLSTSFLGAFVLTLLWFAFQAAINKFFVAIGLASTVVL